MNRPAPSPLSDAERLDSLRLIRSENVGPITYFQFLRHYGSASVAIEALPELARRGGRKKPIRVCARADAEREIAAVEAAGARLIVWGEPDYPALLAVIEDAPPVLALQGHAHLLKAPTIAVVGARNASANGRRLARKLAREIGEGGATVVSGLARGIDAEAHEGSIATGTAAAIAGGIDVVYPEENAALHARIAAEGVLISEQPPATVPTARHFPRRNRLISGLSLGVVVVEAAVRSGSLITARMALEQGREVFAVPGSPLDPRARGANELIRQGAVLTESAADIFGSLERVLRAPLGESGEADFAAAPPAPPAEAEVDRAREVVAAALGPTPVPVDELVRQSGFAPSVVAAVLLELELAGRLDRQPGNQVSLKLG